MDLFFLFPLKTCNAPANVSRWNMESINDVLPEPSGPSTMIFTDANISEPLSNSFKYAKMELIGPCLISLGMVDKVFPSKSNISNFFNLHICKGRNSSLLLHKCKDFNSLMFPMDVGSVVIKLLFSSMYFNDRITISGSTVNKLQLKSNIFNLVNMEISPVILLI